MYSANHFLGQSGVFDSWLKSPLPVAVCGVLLLSSNRSPVGCRLLLPLCIRFSIQHCQNGGAMLQPALASDCLPAREKGHSSDQLGFFCLNAISVYLLFWGGGAVSLCAGWRVNFPCDLFVIKQNYLLYFLLGQSGRGQLAFSLVLCDNSEHLYISWLYLD